MNSESMRLAKNAIKFEVFMFLQWVRHSLGFMPRFVVDLFDVSYDELDELEEKGW